MDATSNESDGTRLQLAKCNRGAELLLLAAIAAHNVADAAETDAATSGPYVTAGVVESSMDLHGIAVLSQEVPEFGDEQSTGWSVGVGYRLSRYLAVEVGRMDFGEKTFVPENDPVTLNSLNVTHRTLVHARVENRGNYFALSGSFPIKDHWEPYATLGAVRAETTAATRIRSVSNSTGATLSEAESSLSDNSTETMFVLGVRYTVGNRYAIVLEAMAIPDLGSEEVTNDGDLKSLSLGFQYRFGLR